MPGMGLKGIEGMLAWYAGRMSVHGIEKGGEAVEELVKMIREMGLPFAYDHFAEGESPEPPFVCYLLPGSDNFAADGKVYYKGTEVHMEVYTDKKDPELEGRVEDVLDAHEVFYNKSETWIGSERLYEVLYIFGWEA